MEHSDFWIMTGCMENSETLKTMLAPSERNFVCVFSTLYIADFQKKNPRKSLGNRSLRTSDD